MLLFLESFLKIVFTKVPLPKFVGTLNCICSLSLAYSEQGNIIRTLVHIFCDLLNPLVKLIEIVSYIRHILGMVGVVVLGYGYLAYIKSATHKRVLHIK